MAGRYGAMWVFSLIFVVLFAYADSSTDHFTIVPDSSLVPVFDESLQVATQTIAKPSYVD